MKLADKLAKTAGKMSPRKLILLCAFFALMIFIILYSTLSSFEDKKEEKTPEVAGVAVIEAATDISPRTVITDDMLKASVVPESLLPPGALTDKRLIVGHKAGVTILAGDLITGRKLDTAAAGFQGLIPDGMRALSFGINDISGVSGFAKPGDHVDILLISSQDGKNRVTSKLLLRDVLLLAINKSSMGQGAAPKKEDKEGNDGNKVSAQPRRTDTSSMGTPAVATVALSPYDAAKLTASLQVGQLQLMLRPAEGADETESVAYYVIPLPKPDPAPSAAPAYAPYPAQAAPQPQVSISGAAGGMGSGIEVIRGTSVTRGQ